MCHVVYFEEILKLWSMEAQRRKCVMEGKSKANKTVTTYENNKKEQLFDSFAILQDFVIKK